MLCARRISQETGKESVRVMARTVRMLASTISYRWLRCLPLVKASKTERQALRLVHRFPQLSAGGLLVRVCRHAQPPQDFARSFTTTL